MRFSLKGRRETLVVVLFIRADNKNPFADARLFRESRVSGGPVRRSSLARLASI
jgi:hypothetical protein